MKARPTLAHLVSSVTPGMRAPDVKYLAIDDTGAKMAHDLSMQDWRTWFPMVVNPFVNTVVTWDAQAYLPGHSRDLLPGEEAHTELALVIMGGYGTVLQRVGDQAYPTPWVFGLKTHGVEYTDLKATQVRVNIGSDHGPITDQTMRDDAAHMAWGPKVADQFGVPDNLSAAVGDDWVKHTKAVLRTDQIPAHILKNQLVECAGMVRVGCAILAVLQLERETIKLPARQWTRKAWDGKRFTPKIEPHTVVIRPDAPRYITEAVQDATERDGRPGEGEGTRKREHDVRAHLRRYRNPDGSIRRTVKVRTHKRGDKTLGKVETTYLVEADPNKGLDGVGKN